MMKKIDRIRRAQAEPDVYKQISNIIEFDTDCFGSKENHADKHILDKTVDLTVERKRILHYV